MPFGDPRPMRRKPKPLRRNLPTDGPGQRANTASHLRSAQPLPSPDCLKVAKMVADALEVAPRVMIPLTVSTGARDWHTVLTELNVKTGVIDVRNGEDEQEYHILVIPKRLR